MAQEIWAQFGKCRGPDSRLLPIWGPTGLPPTPARTGTFLAQLHTRHRRAPTVCRTLGSRGNGIQFLPSLGPGFSGWGPEDWRGAGGGDGCPLRPGSGSEKPSVRHSGLTVIPRRAPWGSDRARTQERAAGTQTEKRCSHSRLVAGVPSSMCLVREPRPQQGKRPGQDPASVNVESGAPEVVRPLNGLLLPFPKPPLDPRPDSGRTKGLSTQHTPGGHTPCPGRCERSLVYTEGAP